MSTETACTTTTESKPCVLECGTSLVEQEYEGRPTEEEQSVVRVDPSAEPSTSLTHRLTQVTSLKELRELLARDVITQHSSTTTFSSPLEDPTSSNPNEHTFLRLPLVYADQTASNRPTRSIEEYLQRVCLPLYGNTHTNTSITGSQSTALVAEARQMVAEACNAKITGKAAVDSVLFVGQGATSAVQLLIDGMGIRHADKQPIVFCGPYEHHSNLIPWREAGCRMVMIPESVRGTVDLEALERQLERYQSERDCLKIGTFCAASNVTGKLSDTRALASLLHAYGALAFFDYATAAPYMEMDMNPPPRPGGASENALAVAKDAIFISPHKCFGGGAGTPGVLICKKNMLSQVNPPNRSGGGTVFYVTHSDHRFLSNRVERYEGGTPHVVGIWRTGLVMRLKKQVELAYQRIAVAGASDSTKSLLPPTLQDFECQTYQKVAAYWRKNAPNLVLLGDDETHHLPIFSFLIRCGERFLHYNYVCAVLNDLFGIQSRGGCQCAGPYSQRLLGLTSLSLSEDRESPNAANRRLEDALVKYRERAELLRPGYTRLSLPFKGLRDEEIEYIMAAVTWVAENGWALMPQYRCNHKTGEWRHANRQGKPLGREERRWLSHYLSPSDPFSVNKTPESIDVTQLLQHALSNANMVLEAVTSDRKNIQQSLKMTDASLVLDDLDDLRWYVYPRECAQWLISETQPVHSYLAVQGPLNPYRAISHRKSKSEETRSRKRKAEITEGSNVISDGEVGHSGEKTKQPKADAEEILLSSTSKRKGTLAKKDTRDSRSWGMGYALSPGSRQSANTKKQKCKHIRPPAKMMRLINQAIFNWDMIENGDRLLLGLSGGKDSLSLLHCLLEFRRKMPIAFELEVCTIDPMTPSFDPSPLIPYIESMGINYHYIRDDIVARASSAGKDGKMVSSLCAFCARMKRGNLYSVARKTKCNKLVLAQHLDDCAESFMMSVMHNGFLRTMKAHYTINEGDLSVIRPMVYCRESLMADFAKASGLPIINENCPACFEEPKERARIKKVLSSQESCYPNFYDNIRRSLIPLMHGDLEPILHGYTADIVSKARKRLVPQKLNKNEDEIEAHDEGKDDERVASPPDLLLAAASEDDIVRELARRKAERHRLAGANKRQDESANAQCVSDIAAKAVCTVDGACSFFD